MTKAEPLGSKPGSTNSRSGAGIKRDATREKKSTISESASRVCYEPVEGHTRERIQGWPKS